MNDPTPKTPRDFYMTFPLRFADHTVEHPTFPAAHPGGWVRITAPDFPTAREYAFDTFKGEWAFIYSAERFRLSCHLYPLGELSHHTVGAQPVHEPTC